MSAKCVILGVVLLAVIAIWAMSKVKAPEKSKMRFKPWYPEK